MSDKSWKPERLDAIRALAGESVFVRIKGSCMEPSLKDGNRVRLRSSSWYWPGDVLVVRSGSLKLAAHRCIGAYWKRGEWRWLTQADSAQRPDASVSLEGIFGKIVGGDCAPEIIRVPVTRRFMAFWRFLRFATRRSLGPVCPLLGAMSVDSRPDSITSLLRTARNTRIKSSALLRLLLPRASSQYFDLRSTRNRTRTKVLEVPCQQSEETP